MPSYPALILAPDGQTAEHFAHWIAEPFDRGIKVPTLDGAAMKLVQLPSRSAVRAAIALSLQHNGASLRCTASQLGMSVRSLQRHLAATGASYSEIVAELRRDTACKLLTETDEQVSHIASRVGYTSASSFSRSFMRMMNVQPISFRRRHAK